MEIGKIPVEILEKIVLNPINQNINKRKEIVLRPKTGEDCSALFFGDELCVVSSDPITGADSDIGYIAVHINCNDIAAGGAEPIGIMITVLLPKECREEVLEDIMSGVYKASNELGIEVLGGHTEVTEAVNKPIVSATILGKSRGKKIASSCSAVPGQGIIMTKWAGIEGTSIISKDYEKELKLHFDSSFIKKAQSLKSMISVVKESLIAVDFEVSAMHDATEGGILGAVWEIAECSETGIEIFKDKIPVLEETKKICELLKIDPLRLISSGSLIITAFNEDKLAKALCENGIFATIIGKVTENGKFVIENGKETVLNPPGKDEIYNINFKDL